MPQNKLTQYELELASAMRAMEPEEQLDFLEALDIYDTFFVPDRDDCHEVIAKVDGQYYLWSETEGMYLLAKLLLEEQEEQ